VITSLHSPHVERVKALLGSKGKKFRKSEGLFISDGYQAIKSALSPAYVAAPQIEKIYATESGLAKLQSEIDSADFEKFDLFIVSEEVMSSMTEAETSQGVLTLCTRSPYTFQKLRAEALASRKLRVAYFWQMQDPGNAGTVIRSADAFGCDAVIFSPDSVDIYSPKTVRATVGSLWNLPVIEDVDLDDLRALAQTCEIPTYAFDSLGEGSLLELPSPSDNFVTIFGNEARGLPEFPPKDGHVEVQMVKIPMLGSTESLNVASAATIALFHLSIGRL